jgi:Putative beta-barrel porin 2
MNRRLALWTGLGALLVARVASAQDVTIGYQGLPYKATGETNTGIQLSDDLLLHAGIGAEYGYDTNVFYSNTDTQGSAILRVMPYLELTNASRNGPTATNVTFDLRGGLQYRHYFSDASDIQPYRDAWMPNGGLSVNVGGGSQFGFGFADVFARIEDPPYANSGVIIGGPIDRYNNQASIEGRWSPGGGRLTSLLRLTDMFDYYSGQYSYANAVTNTLTFDVSWKWLPKTAVFFDAQQGNVDYLNNQSVSPTTGQTLKVSSYPLRVTVGLRGLLTSKTSALLQVGYANGFYSSGGSTNGFLGSTFAEAAVTVRVTELSRLVVGVRHDFINAVIANFAYEETAYLSYTQQIAGRLALDLSGRYAHLSYQGNLVDLAQQMSGRTDNLYQAGAALDYFMRNWVYLGVGYSFLDNRSNVPVDSYVKQQVFARLGITY